MEVDDEERFKDLDDEDEDDDNEDVEDVDVKTDIEEKVKKEEEITEEEEVTNKEKEEVKVTEDNNDEDNKTDEETKKPEIFKAKARVYKENIKLLSRLKFILQLKKKNQRSLYAPKLIFLIANIKIYRTFLELVCK